MGKSSAGSAANAACDHMRDWWVGTPEGSYSSMAVFSDGNPYGIPDGLVFSFPCICKDKQWKLVEGIDVG